MVRIILAVAALFGLMWFFSHLGRLSGSERTSYLKRAAVYGVVGLLLLMVVTGRAPWMFALAAGAIPWMRRAMLLRQFSGVFSRMGIRIPGLDRVTGGIDDLFTGGVRESRFLRLSRDHETRRLNGTVLAGRFEGRHLEAMSLEELMNMLGELHSQDAESEKLLISYLDETFDGWREQFGGTRNNEVSMTYSEALEVLGLEVGASRNEIVNAHRKLMAKVHPDRGGVDWLAAKLNQAKNVLLGDKPQGS